MDYSNKKQVAAVALSVLDLTSLNDDDNEGTILELCEKATDRIGYCAAVCVWPRFAGFAKAALPQGFKVATVVNFPGGDLPTEQVSKEVLESIANGADEIDLVLPYKALIAGDEQIARLMVRHVRGLIDLVKPEVVLKVILETGCLEAAAGAGWLVDKASIIAIEEGADFIKTSTGKVPVGATPESVRSMAKVIAKMADAHPFVGLKVSGGVKTVDQAAQYMQIVEQELGREYLEPVVFRIGASGIWVDIKNILTDSSSNKDLSSAY